MFLCSAILSIWQNMMHFFSWTFLWTRWSSIRSETTLSVWQRFLLWYEADYLLTFRFHGKEIFGKTVITYELLWMNRRTVSLSYSISHISLVGRLKIETDSTTFKCFLRFIVNMTLCSSFVFVTVFVLALHYYCRFHAHTNSTFALLWKWTCWRCYRPCMLWNCRLEVPSTLEQFFG